MAGRFNVYKAGSTKAMAGISVSTIAAQSNQVVNVEKSEMARLNFEILNKQGVVKLNAYLDIDLAKINDSQKIAERYLRILELAPSQLNQEHA